MSIINLWIALNLAEIIKAEHLLTLCLLLSVFLYAAFRVVLYYGFLQRLNPAYGFLRVLMAAERGQTEVPFSARSKTGSRSSDHIGSFQQIIKEFPARHAVRGL